LEKLIGSTNKETYPLDEQVEKITMAKSTGKTMKELVDLRQQSIFASNTHSTSFDSFDESVPQFEPIDVKVQVLGLVNGIAMETTHKESQKIHDGTSNGLGNVPVFAVVTGFNEIKRRNKVVATHLPSIPLETPASSIGKKHQYVAVWPADFDPQGNPTSCTTFARKMRKVPIKSLEGVQTNDTKTCMYTTEKLVLAISLMRGNEMITLGAVNVHYTGAETQSVQASLPVKVTKEAVKKVAADMKGVKVKKHSNRRAKKEKRSFVKAQSFKGDPGRSYRLDEDAVLTIMIQSLKKSKARQRSEAAKAAQQFSRDVVVDSVDSNAERRVFTQADVLLDLINSEDIANGRQMRHQEPFTPTHDNYDSGASTLESAPSDEEGGRGFQCYIDSSCSEDSDETEELVSVDAGTHGHLTSPALLSPYSMSLISSSKKYLRDEDSTARRKEHDWQQNSSTAKYICRNP